MGLVDRLKRRLPILGSPSATPPRPAPGTPAPRPAASRPTPPDEPDARFTPAGEAGRGNRPVNEYLEDTVKKNSIVLFMKGSPLAPQCGFSAGAAGILAEYGKPFAHVNVLADPEVREAVKQYTSWPTIPQVFIGGEFVGGADILRQLHDSGELRPLIEKATAAPS